tara:strand:+ start:152 stop:1180 length:1029 start_codon:yes stop_codon:yes gene_type:complete
MKKLNWGVIGLGNIAQKFLEGFSFVRNSNLLAIASKSQSKLSKFKKEFNINDEFVFNNYEDLINCKDVDIVYISLPNSFHYKWILECIHYKKKVLVEKPAFLNYFEAQSIRKIIKEKKIFFTEGFMYRYHPQINKIVNIIKNNEIGKPLSMKSSFGINILTKKKFIFFNKKKKINKESRLFNKNLGGGCILDLGCYPTSFSLLVASLIDNINFQNFKLLNIENEIGETGVDIDAKMEIIFNNTFISEVEASFKKNLGNISIIKGEKGEIIINDTWQGKDGFSVVIGNKTYDINDNGNINIFSYEIESISKSILNGSSETSFPGIKIDETLTNMKVLDEWRNG